MDVFTTHTLTKKEAVFDRPIARPTSDDEGPSVASTKGYVYFITINKAFDTDDAAATFGASFMDLISLAGSPKRHC